jgi:hypothetical protein
MGWVDSGDVEGCGDTGAVVVGAGLEEGCLKEKFETGTVEGGLPKVKGAEVAASAIVELGISVADDGV